MTLPTRLSIHNYSYALDGGTTCLRMTDETGRGHTVILTQHAFPRVEQSTGVLPGRLYFDGQLIPIRSEFEAGVLSLLRSAEIQYHETLPSQGEQITLSPNALILGDDIREVLTHGPEDNIRSLTARVIQFVDSDQYLWFMERVEQETDCTRYVVKVVWDGETFHRAIVRTKQLLGVGLREAREVVEQD